jgi:cellulose synthase/poly-beta-1,6-N-acetylglucosamine synthase-like glycosyltransferase
VAFSKKAVQAAGGQFWPHPTGEDVEFSIQIQKAGFKLYYAPKAIVKHMHRVDMTSFNKQWFGYGKGHSFLVEKHASQVMEIVFQFLPGNPRVSIPFPLKGLVYLGNFHLICLTFLATIITTIGALMTDSTSWQISMLISLILWLFFMIRYFKGCINLSPKKHFFTWCYIKWATNYWFIKGGLDGTKKTGVLYIEPSW